MTQYVGLYNYWVVIFLMMTGFYIVIARSNLIQKVIGLNIFQISVFLLYITMGKVTGGTAPILPYHHDHHADIVVHASADIDSHSVTADDAHAAAHSAPDTDTTDNKAHTATPADTEPGDRHSADITHADTDHEDQAEQLYTHPLPSVLMLTAIVVGVATTALALALVIRIGEAYGTIEEDEILQRDREDS